MIWDPGRIAKRSRLHGLARLVRVEHTLFSLPFAYVGALLSGGCSLECYLWITLAVFGLRTAAMSFNNIADLDIDRINPRSMNRPLVIGAVSLRDAWVLVVLGSLLYYFSAYMLNIYTRLLSPLLWIIAMSYPYAKRIHWLPHLHLGFTLGLVVFGGSVASTGGNATSIIEVVSRVPWIYVGAVTLWVAGFDIIYSIMDYDFDKKQGLGSIPAKLGIRNAVIIAAATHIVSIILFFVAIYVYKLGIASLLATIGASMLLVYQHVVVNKSLRNIPYAFNLNLYVGVLVSIGIIIDKIL